MSRFRGVYQGPAAGAGLEIGPYDTLLRSHRAWMATEEAKVAYRRRKELPEPVFGILKEQQAARRFLLRGLTNVKAEWAYWPPPSTSALCGGSGPKADSS